MAVELAKVSLWLDCFTLGAPLSFLDHHLRRGNSLLGTTVKEVDEASRTSGHALLGSAFTGRKLAVDMMSQVGAMPDVTAAQVRESRSAYARAADALAAPARVLDVYFCRDVLEAPATEKQAKRGKKVVRAADSWAVQFLQEHRVSEYLWADDEAARKKCRANLTGGEREQLDKVAAESEARALFHWELGFPEVFYGPRPGTRQTIERLPEGGFDAVVGNPPWIRQEGLKRDKEMFEHTFPEVFHSEADIYVCFLGRSLKVLRPGGRLGMLVQNKWFKAGYAERLRTHLASEATPSEVVDFGHSPLFPDADTFPCIVVVENQRSEEGNPVSFAFVDRNDLKADGDDFDLFDYAKRHRKLVAWRQLRPETWWMMGEAEYALMEKIRAAGVPLKTYVGDRPYRGALTGGNDAFYVDQATRDRLVAEDPGCKEIIKPFLRGEDISRWQSRWDGQWMIFARRGIEIRKYPSILAHLKQFKRQLEPRSADWDEDKQGKWPGRKAGSYKWFELQDTVDYYDKFERPKIIYQEIQYHSWFALDRKANFLNNKGFLIPSEDLCLLAILNSGLMWWYLARHIGHMKDEAFAMQGFKVEEIPIRGPDGGGKEIATSAATLCELTAKSGSLREEFTSQMGATLGTPTLGAKLERFSSLDEADFIAALGDCVRKNGGRPLAPAAQAKLVQAWRKSRAEMRRLTREICTLEIDLHHRVFDLYGLTPDEVRLLRETAPPRCPLKLAEEELARLDGDRDPG